MQRAHRKQLQSVSTGIEFDLFCFSPSQNCFAENATVHGFRVNGSDMSGIDAILNHEMVSCGETTTRVHAFNANTMVQMHMYINGDHVCTYVHVQIQSAGGLDCFP